jgi:hypothetical protein
VPNRGESSRERASADDVVLNASHRHKNFFNHLGQVRGSFLNTELQHGFLLGDLKHVREK